MEIYISFSRENKKRLPLNFVAFIPCLGKYLLWYFMAMTQANKMTNRAAIKNSMNSIIEFWIYFYLLELYITHKVMLSNQQNKLNISM